MSGTPFTVFDSNDVAAQGTAPEITGFSAQRPNLNGNPNNGPRSVGTWLNASAFQRLDLTLKAGQFGTEGSAGIHISRSTNRIDAATGAQVDPALRRSETQQPRERKAKLRACPAVQPMLVSWSRLFGSFGDPRPRCSACSPYSFREFRDWTK
jgi:hypothetical protein